MSIQPNCRLCRGGGATRIHGLVDDQGRSRPRRALRRRSGYVRVDAVQAYSLYGRPLERQFNIDNLFDQTYVAGSHVHISRYILPGAGRNGSVSLSYRLEGPHRSRCRS